ncbi:MAG TPA: stage II sporulation protein P [Firmicutes bacterium]|nr:stage II sporulation protein P [Bacillota bacterium]
MAKKGCRICSLVLLLLLALTIPVWGETEREDGYYTLVNEEGEVICRTSHQVGKGDQYLSADNYLYRVEEVKEDTAHLRLVRKVNLEAAIVPSLAARIGTALSQLLARGEEYVQGENRPVAIYHTHSDESYVPTDGSSSVHGNGGILRVGDSMAQTLQERGSNVVHDKTSHEPHDAMAYDRSRRTAVELLKKNPIALIDIHRDAVPPDEYAEEINNTAVTKAQLVVGRQNPNMKANEAFAQQVKAEVDKKYPGFIKGIFYGKGKYNQDLAPRMLLVELGAHQNSREEAERGAAIFATAAQDVLTRAGASNRAVGGGSTRALLWIIGLAIVGIGIYSAINGGLGRSGAKIGGTTGGTGTDGEDPKEE